MKKPSMILTMLLALGAYSFAEDFFQICQSGTPDQVRAALGAGARTTDRNKDGLTPLMVAAQCNQDPEVMDILLKSGAKLGDKDRKSMTPIMWAATANPNPEVLTALFRAGAKISDRPYWGMSLLMWAAGWNQNPGIIDFLLKDGAKLDEEDLNGMTALMWAAEFNPNPETIATLLRSGAKVDEQDNGGMTALMWAAQTNSYLQTRNPKVITILLQAGANADLRSRVDKTALDYARGNKQLKDTKEFAALAKCSSGNASYVPGYQISMRLIGAAREGTTADVQALLAGGAPVDAEVEYEDGMTPLMAAAKDNADPAVIKILLKAGAKIDGQDKEGRTALMLAARWNPNPEATSTLLRAGADANVKSTYGKTAVEFAASNEKLIGTAVYLQLQKATSIPAAAKEKVAAAPSNEARSTPIGGEAPASRPSLVFRADGEPISGSWATYQNQAVFALDSHISVFVNADPRYRPLGMRLQPGHLSGAAGLERFPAWSVTAEYDASVVPQLENYGDLCHLLFHAEDAEGRSLFLLKDGSLKRLATLPGSLVKGGFLSLHPYINLMADSAPRAKIDKGAFLVATLTEADAIENLLSSPQVMTVASQMKDQPFDTVSTEQYAPGSAENVYGSRPEIVPFANPDGSVSVAWLGKAGIHVSEFGDRMQLVDDHLLGAEWPIFGGFTRDPAGNYYVLTAKENRDGDFSSNLRLAKYGPNLKKSAVCDLPTGKGDGFDVMSPLAVSTGRLAADSGHVYIHIGKAMHKYIDGLNHQSGIQVAVRTKDMKVDMAASMKSTASHSFDQRMTLDGKDPIIADLADNYPRGIVLGRPPSNSDSRVVFTYKTQMASDAVNPAGKRMGVGMWSNDNKTYSELGGLAVVSTGYVLLAAGEARLDNRLAASNLNEPRNLFMILAAPEFWKQPVGRYRDKEEGDLVSDQVVISSGQTSEVSSFYDFNGGQHFQRNCGVVWLTDYSDKEQSNALRPKLARLSDDRLVALWEKWGSKDFLGTYYLIFDATGKILKPAEILGPQRLQRGDDVIISKDRVIWFTGEAARQLLIAHILRP